jgi:YHS domain-containing protein
MQYRDPVCGMTVDSRTAAAEATYAGENFYFCSTACRDRFDANPSQFLSASRARGATDELERHEPPRTTKDGWTAPKFGSASSGGGEFDPAPEQHERDSIGRGQEKQRKRNPEKKTGRKQREE